MVCPETHPASEEEDCIDVVEVMVVIGKRVSTCTVEQQYVKDLKMCSLHADKHSSGLNCCSGDSGVSMFCCEHSCAGVRFFSALAIIIVLENIWTLAMHHYPIIYIMN